MKNCLLLGRKGVNIDHVKESLGDIGIKLFGGTDIQTVKDTFDQHKIDVVIIGAGIDLEDRLEMIKYIFEHSTSTAVHMKDWDSGPAGMLPFVSGVLRGALNKA